MSNRLHLDPGDSAFSHLSLSASRTLKAPKCVVSFDSGGSCFSLSAQRTPPSTQFTSCMVSCHLAHAPLSLLISSYLPALTVLWNYNDHVKYLKYKMSKYGQSVFPTTFGFCLNISLEEMKLLGNYLCSR